MTGRRTLTIRAGELDVAVDVAGAGPPVVLVHGGLGGRLLWRPQVEALAARGYTAIAYDLRGHGDTRGPRDRARYDARLLADDLLALAKALELERFSLVGLSLGGFVAQEVAIAHPDRVHALVLADTWLKMGATAREQTIGRALGVVVPIAVRALGMERIAALAARGTPDHNGYERELVRAAIARVDPDEALRVWRGLAHHDTRGRIARVTAPTLVIAGALDATVTQSHEIRRLIDGAELIVLPEAGHGTNLQRPAAFNAALLPFLDRAHAGRAQPAWDGPPETGR